MTDTALNSQNSLREGRRTVGLPAATVNLELLRGFTLRHDGESLELPPVTQRVVAFLALEDRPIHRLVVAGTLWMDHGPDQASASLRTALWRLHRVVADLVMTHGPMLSLSDDVRVDVRRAEKRAALLVKAPEEYCEKDLAVLRDGGDVLPDWYDDWVIVGRERYRQLRLHALESLCRSLAAAGAFGEAVSAGLAAVADEPLRESAHRVLMAAHEAEGNICEALRHYEMFRRRLADEVGLEPSPRMMMMVARLRVR